MRRTTAAVAAFALIASVAYVVNPANDAFGETTLPNVLVIVTDDQPKGTVDAMPNVLNRIADKGVTFTNGIAPTALCCPSRASLLTGNQSHTTGVYTNEADFHGAWPAFHAGPEADTLATRLDAAGYNTGLFGKYINGYQRYGWNKGIVPPGWDTFRAMLPDGGGDGTYYQYGVTGLDRHYGTAPADYSTDVFGQMAVDHILSTPADQPWLVYYAPYGPHAPINPAPRHDGTWPTEQPSAIGALNEKDVSDKPGWVANNDPVAENAVLDQLTRQHEVVRSIDEWVGRLLDAADLSNTVVVFLADNGYMLGAHRITGKNVPYARATEIPMYVRWDGVAAANTRSDRVTPQIDLTALIADAAGTPWNMDGRNALTTWRTGVAVEQVRAKDPFRPAYCGWRTQRYLYVEYDEGKGREFYDYANDPDELDNAVRLDRYAERVTNHRQNAKAACLPTPPGFAW